MNNSGRSGRANCHLFLAVAEAGTHLHFVRALARTLASGGAEHRAELHALLGAIRAELWEREMRYLWAGRAWCHRHGTVGRRLEGGLVRLIVDCVGRVDVNAERERWERGWTLRASVC